MKSYRHLFNRGPTITRVRPKPDIMRVPIFTIATTTTDPASKLTVCLHDSSPTVRDVTGHTCYVSQPMRYLSHWAVVMHDGKLLRQNAHAALPHQTNSDCNHPDNVTQSGAGRLYYRRHWLLLQRLMIIVLSVWLLDLRNACMYVPHFYTPACIWPATILFTIYQLIYHRIIPRSSWNVTIKVPLGWSDWLCSMSPPPLRLFSRYMSTVSSTSVDTFPTSTVRRRHFPACSACKQPLIIHTINGNQN